MRARVTTGGRLHFGFQNLSLARERLYGGVGAAVERPRLVVEAEPADGVRVVDESAGDGDGSGAAEIAEGVAAETAEGVAAGYAARAVDLLGVPGAAVTVERRLPRHVGLGSGTQLALSTLLAVALAHDRDPDVRALAPELGRGGRSGVGVACFEAGGFVVDAGHPTGRFTTDRPADGEWAVPPAVARHDLPGDWRFVLAVPDVEAGRSGDDEDESMRAVVERADPAVADEVGVVVTQRLLPAVATGDLPAFGAAVATLGRRNGAWYADEQGGVYRPPVGTVVDELGDAPAVEGAGQSSWGPTVYGVTDADRAEDARRAARTALDAADLDGEVVVTGPRNRGAIVEVE